MRNPQKCGFFYSISKYLYKNINRMKTLDDLLTALITGQHGWNVGEQFERTWDGSQSVEDQNGNAMEKIVGTLEDLVSSELLSKWAVIDIVTYIRRVKEGLARQDEDEDEEPTDDNQNLQEQILKDFKRFL